jgi:cysteine synthase A
VLNQFCEFGNHLGHYEVTGRALGHVFETVRGAAGRDLRLAAFTSATGSAGTIAAGDRLKDDYGTKIVAVEALECPTMLENGFGEHNIQGIGDKHIPLIHNVMNTDVVVAHQRPAPPTSSYVRCSTARTVWVTWPTRRVPRRCSPRSSTSAVGHLQRARRHQDRQAAGPGPRRRHRHRGHRRRCAVPQRVRAKITGPRLRRRLHQPRRCQVWGEHLANVPTAHTLELTERERNRIFNLGYYTWVEQQGTPFELFEARRHQSFWQGLRRLLPVWDDMITEFNARVAARADPMSSLHLERPLIAGWQCAVCGASRRHRARRSAGSARMQPKDDRHHAPQLRAEHFAAAVER